jgi:putative endonuclease
VTTLKTPLEHLKEAFARLGREPEAERLEGLRGVGQQGEDVAVDALRRAGYEIVERNFRTPIGEIDIVAREAGVLCFVEVKWRRDPTMGHPAESVTPEKQRRLARTAEWYLARHRQFGAAARFDVVAILEDDGTPTIEIIRNAFSGPYRPRRRRR